MPKPEIIYVRRMPRAYVIEPKPTATTLERSIRARNALLEMIEERTAQERKRLKPLLNRLLAKLQDFQQKERQALDALRHLRQLNRGPVPQAPRLAFGRDLDPADFERKEKPPIQKELKKAFVTHRKLCRAIEDLLARIIELEEHVLAPRRIIMREFFSELVSCLPKTQTSHPKEKAFLKVSINTNIQYISI